MAESKDLEEYLAEEEQGAAAAARREPDREAYAGMRVLPDIIDEAVRKGIRVVLTPLGYEIDGFYRGGPMRVEADAAGDLMAIDRKEKKVLLGSFDDLVRLNYEWWKASRDKRADWVNPGKEWVEEFGRLNLVKRQVMFIPGDE